MVAGLLGGVLIGLAAALMLFANGRVAGISGIVGNLLRPAPGDVLWRAMFVLGLIGTGAIALRLAPGAFQAQARPLWLVGAAGLLVGFGTRLGSGCTSGHGVCGVSRFSPRSIAATATFTAAGAATVYVARHLLGGGS
jgi:uncharacterized membrane protein YedE/YeeE